MSPTNDSYDFLNETAHYSPRSPATYGSEIERHLDMIIQLVGQEYKEKILNMQRSLNEKEYEKNALSTEIKNYKEKFSEQEIEQRKAQEQLTNHQYRFHQMEKLLLEKDEEYHKLFSQYAYVQNEDRNKENSIRKLQGDIDRLEKENRYLKSENMEKEKKVIELDDKVKFLMEKLYSMEKFVETKDQTILQVERLLMDEKDSIKQLEVKLKDFEEESYALRGQIERIKRERDFIQEEMDKHRNRQSSPL